MKHIIKNGWVCTLEDGVWCKYRYRPTHSSVGNLATHIPAESYFKYAVRTNGKIAVLVDQVINGFSLSFFGGEK